MRIRAGLLLGLALLPWGCRFERRPDLLLHESGSFEVEPTAPTSPAEDSVRAVVAALGEALQLGDVARVARLTVPAAVLVDQEEAVRWTHDSPEAPLPNALVGQRGGQAWILEASHFSELGGAGLLVNEYRSATPDGPQWRAAETFVLVRTQEGWRLRHLHRSRGPAGGELFR